MDNDSFGEGAGSKRPPRDPGAPDFEPSAPAPARTVRLAAGDFLLTVNPVDGSEIEPAPPGGPAAMAPPVRRTAAERAEHERAAQPPVPPGPAAARLPLLERETEREHIGRLLARGRSLRITGPAGSGRTALLDAVAEDCADLAPDGVVRLSGCHRTPADLLHELFAAVHHAPRHRPGRAELLRRVADIGAVVLLDDLEFGGAALSELLDATPECAFVLAAAPEVAEPAAESRLEEVPLAGLGRAASLELLRRVAERPLDEDETNWAGDLWFESEGLPLRFVQAGALLRQCDELRERLGDDPGAFAAFTPSEGAGGAGAAPSTPTLAQGAAPAPLLASRLSESARKTLRFAVALGGEVPHQAHLPALIGDTHADTAIGELLGCGLLSPVGERYRLAAGVLLQLKEQGYADESAAHAHAAAQHYTWWTGHPSVTPERAALEADAVVAALTALVASRTAGPDAEDTTGHPSAAVLLARSAAPAFAAGLHWGAWERALRIGSEAARIAGEVAEEAYFHHELGVLALCTDRVDRARAELETSIGMRGALADKRGTVAGRRALALVDDREKGRVPGGSAAAGPAAALRPGEPVPPRPLALPPGRGAALPDRADATSTRPLPVASGTLSVPRTVIAPRPPYPSGPVAGLRHRLFAARRNVVAVGTGVLIAAVLGTVVTLAPASESQDPPGDTVRGGQPADQDDSRDGTDAGQPPGDEGGSGEAPEPGRAEAPPSGAPAASGSSAPAAPGPSGETSADPAPSSSRPAQSPSSDGTAPTPPTGEPPTGEPSSSRPPSGRPSSGEPTTEEPSTGPSSPSTPTEAPSSPGDSTQTSASAPITPTSATPAPTPDGRAVV
ncbi:ATP-binding protein [Streptomyces jumonjinensis]|uniref:ATP-binding protein n=1 Tax=Streptomyces jumonjinensis TaxID=1945 RepID=UPI00379685C9